MKKNILLFVFATAVSGPVLSQSWRVAPTFGLNASTSSYSSGFKNALTSTDINLRTGVLARAHAGVYIDRAISDRLSVRSGLLYTGKGGRLTLTSTQNSAVSAQVSFRFSYLEIPLLVNVALGDNGLRLIGGPVLGVALNGKGITQTRDAGVVSESETTNLRIGDGALDDFRPTDLSVSLGLVKQLNVGDDAFEIGLHTQPSLARWTPKRNAYPENFARNLVAGLRVAYLFDLRR